MTETSLNVGAGKTAPLSDAPLVLLSDAANRDDSTVLPPPASVRARGGALEKVLRRLLVQGLVEEIPVATAEQAWRTTEDGARIGLRVTRFGLNAIGSGATDEGPDHVEVRSAANEAHAGKENSAGPHDEGAPDSSRASQTSDIERAKPSALPDQGGDQADLPRAIGIRPGSKQALLLEQLQRPAGASVAELVNLLGWQPHTVRAAITGLRQKGHAISRSKNEQGETVYQANAQAAPRRRAGAGSCVRSREMTLTTSTIVEAPIWRLDREAAGPANRVAATAVTGASHATGDTHPPLAHAPKPSSKAAQFGPAPPAGAGADCPLGDSETAPTSAGPSRRWLPWSR